MKKVIIRILGPVIVLGAAWYGYRFFKLLPQRQEQVATARVRRSDVVIRAYSRGELRAVRSITLTAPNLFSTVQVTRLAPVGALAKDKDLIVEFDDSERRAALEEDLLAVEQVDEQIKKAKADLAIRDNQDQVDLLRTRYAVRRAELEVKRNPIISAIDAKKNLLTLEEQRRRLQQLESDIKSRQAQALAELAVLQETRNKSMIDVAREKQRIAQTKVLSTMTGLVAIKQNRSGFFMFGQQMPDIREGDTLQPGMPVADVLDLSELEVIAKVGELDRANLHEGQDVVITLDAVPEKRIHGKIKSLSGTASANVFSGDPAKKFDVVFAIDMRQLLTELGVKPAAIQRIMETAERNAKKAPAAPTPPSMAAMMGGGPGMPMQAAPGGAAPPNAGRSNAGGMSAADQQKMRDAVQRALAGKNPQTMTAEEKQKLADQLRSTLGAIARPPAAGGGAPRTPMVIGPVPPGAPAGRRGGPAGAMDFMQVASAASQFSEKDLADAKLPPPPEEDSQLEVLLRPGLLADVEIIVEKIPNALHVPVQAVFERDGRQIVWLRKGSKFEARPVEIAKRSESTMVLAGGVQPGDMVALADPYEKKTAKKAGESKKGGGGNPMGGAVSTGGDSKGGK